MKKTVIAVLFGGCSTEYEVSLQSAYAVLEHLDKSRFTPLAVGITRQGAWNYYTGPYSRILDGTWASVPAFLKPCILSSDRTRHELLVFTPQKVCYAIDAVFPVLHGKNGEDGTVQGAVQLAGIPLIGCGTLSSALCMDKKRAHDLVRLAGIESAKSVCIQQGDSDESIIGAAKALQYPIFVKPVRSGSSFGITRLTEPQELLSAVRQAFAHDRQVLLEEAVDGVEVGCAIYGNETLSAGLVDEIELSNGFFNFEEKYTLKTSQIHCPARISDETAAELIAAAKQIYRILDCRVFARVDLFLTPSGKIYFNEVNTIPGFTPHSRFPTMLQGVGLSFTELLSKLIELGMQP